MSRGGREDPAHQHRYFRQRHLDARYHRHRRQPGGGRLPKHQLLSGPAPWPPSCRAASPCHPTATPTATQTATRTVTSTPTATGTTTATPRPDGDRDEHGVAHSNRHRLAYRDADDYRNGARGDSNPHPHGDQHCAGWGDGHADRDSDQHRAGRSDGYRNPHANRDGDADANGHADDHGDALPATQRGRA